MSRCDEGTAAAASEFIGDTFFDTFECTPRGVWRFLRDRRVRVECWNMCAQRMPHFMAAVRAIRVHGVWSSVLSESVAKNLARFLERLRASVFRGPCRPRRAPYCAGSTGPTS